MNKQENVKIYCGQESIFICNGINILGTGFQPIIDQYISKLSSAALYWINISSAILDNATLTAAEITHNMTTSQIKAILLGLLVAGGMLIQVIFKYNFSRKIKNFKQKLGKLGVPLGLIMLVNFLILFINSYPFNKVGTWYLVFTFIKGGLEIFVMVTSIVFLVIFISARILKLYPKDTGVCIYLMGFCQRMYGPLAG